MPPKLADLLLPDEKLIRFDVLQHSFNQILIEGNLFLNEVQFFVQTMGCVDTKLEFGQTRVVSEDVVQQRVEELSSNPPSVPLRLIVHLEPGISF